MYNNHIVHESHDMTEWEPSVVTIIETPRFGRIRQCKHCGGEQAETASGKGTHDELLKQCTGTD